MAKKNLLDAFQRVAAEQQTRVDVPEAAAPAPVVSSPRGVQPLRPPPRAAAFALAAVALVGIGFALGRATSSGVRAAPSETAPPLVPSGSVMPEAPRNAALVPPPVPVSASTARDTAPPALDTPGERFERALRDPANRYTIQVISYANQPAQRALAQELVEHLRAAGFETSDPRPTGRHLVVLVGTAASEADLKGTLDRVRAARDPRGRAGQFSDALVLPISNFVPR